MACIGLLGQFGSGNSGNDGTLEAAIQPFRRSWPAAELVCICPGTMVVARRYLVRAIGIGAPSREEVPTGKLGARLFNIQRRARNLAWPFARMRQFDAIIIAGTGILDDFCETPWGWPYVILRWCLAARLNRVPVYFVSIGAGPIRNPLSRLFMKTAARIATYRSYRDGLSRDFMTAIGIDTRNDDVTCDLAFGLDRPEAPARAASGRLCVGVGIMNYTGWRKHASGDATVYDTYLTKMHAFVTWLLDEGMQVRLLTGDAADRKSVRDLMDVLGDAAANPDLSAEPTESLGELMTQIAETDIVVATRYHNVVCALKMGRPTISLGYAEKNDELLRRTGLGAYCHHVETFDVESLKRQVETMIGQRHALARIVEEAAERFRANLEAQDMVLMDRLTAARRKAAR